ncbi:MAG: coenzyme F430 synthase [Methanosarcina sp.]
MDLCRKKLAVLDLTHGGIPIAKNLAALGNKVCAIDVYRTVNPDILTELETNHGIHCSKVSLPVSEFDFLVAPVHLDPAYPMLAKAREQGIRIFSHHEIVGKILKQDSRLSGIKIIEVTGVKAKTSTASLLADMLSRNSEVILHTSRGLEAWKGGSSFLLARGLSITPGSILVAVKKVFEAGLNPDYFIFEISIGGTGNADLGILTTLSPDYGIANNTALASEAKLELIRNVKPGSTLIINSAAKKALFAAKTSQAKLLTFKDPFNEPVCDNFESLSGNPLVLDSKGALNSHPLTKLESQETLDKKDFFNKQLFNARFLESGQEFENRKPSQGSNKTGSNKTDKKTGPVYSDFAVEIESENGYNREFKSDSNSYLKSETELLSNNTLFPVLNFISKKEKIFSAFLLQGYNISAYKTAFVAASAAALVLGVEPKDIVSVIKEFRGLSGRMQEKETNGVALIDNSNSGMDILSAEKALEYVLLKKKDEKKQGIILVLGEEASQVCEGLPPAAVQGFLGKFGEKFKHIILVGERMKSITAKNVFYAGSLPEGLSKASEFAGKDDIILSSVKCFR